MITKLEKIIDDFVKERDKAVKEACRTDNLEPFKIFYRNYQARGVYSRELPSDEVLEIVMRKILFNIRSATEEERAAAEKWLHEHGSDTDFIL